MNPERMTSSTEMTDPPVNKDAFINIATELTLGRGGGGAEALTIPMRKPRLFTAILILVTPTVMTAQSPKVTPVRSYTTRFQLDEDPISEGGKWINGGKDGIDWYNVITKNGVAYGAVTQGDYTDPTALLAGTWGKNQKVKARVFSRNQTEKYYQEVEIRLRSTLIAAPSAPGTRCSGDA